MDKDVEVGKTAPELKLFVGGHWIEGREWYEVQDKLTGDVLASVPIAEEDLYEMAAQAAYDSIPAMAGLAPDQRAARLRRWADRLEAKRAEIVPTLGREAALPPAWAEHEVLQAATALRRAAVEAERGPTDWAPSTYRAAGATSHVEFALRYPIGTVAALLPDGHALFHAAQAAGAALASGCSVILAASPLAPLGVLRFLEIGSALGWPPGGINLLFGSFRDLGLKLAADPRMALVVLAGPDRDRAAVRDARAGRPYLEAGEGQSCALLDRTADVSAAVTAILNRCFQQPPLGQPSPRFILAPQAVSGKLKESLAAGLVSLAGAQLQSDAVAVPHQLTDSLAQRAVDWCNSICQDGAILVCGGQRRGTFIEPAVLTAPAGSTPLPPPPSAAPYFIVDVYDHDALRQLRRIPDLAETLVFTADVQSALEILHLPGIPRVELFATRPGRPAAQYPPGNREVIRHIMAGMIQHQRVGLHLST